MPETRHEAALRHVLSGRKIVAAQRTLVTQLRQLGKDARREEALLVQFEQSLAIFEYDLQQIEQQEL